MPEHCYSPIYVWVFQVIPLLQISPPKLCINFSSPHTSVACPVRLILSGFVSRIISVMSTNQFKENYKLKSHLYDIRSKQLAVQTQTGRNKPYQLVKILYGTQGFVTAFTWHHHVSVSCARWIQITCSSFKTNPNIQKRPDMLGVPPSSMRIGRTSIGGKVAGGLKLTARFHLVPR